jgi:cell division protein FtsB
MSEIHKRLRQELEKTLAMNAKLAARVRELEAERDRLKNPDAIVIAQPIDG